MGTAGPGGGKSKPSIHKKARDACGGCIDVIVRGRCPPFGRPTALLPFPAAQNDRHTTLASLLLKADLAPDPLERILAMARCVQTGRASGERGSRGLAGSPPTVSTGLTAYFGSQGGPGLYH